MSKYKKGEVHMTNQERIEKYKKENCSKCIKNIDCKILRRIDGKLTCTEEEQSMKDINYANCMQRRCEQCRYYDYCFRYRPRKDVKTNAKRKTK